MTSASAESSPDRLNPFAGKPFVVATYNGKKIHLYPGDGFVVRTEDGAAFPLVDFVITEIVVPS